MRSPAATAETVQDERVELASISIELASISLFALIQEPPAGVEATATVLFLHGITGHAYVWVPVMADVAAAGFRAVALDQRGHGRSSKPEDPAEYGVDAYVADIFAIRDALRLGPLVLVGHSLGGRNALFAAASRPDDVTSAVILDYTPFIEEQRVTEVEERTETGNRPFESSEAVMSHLARRYPHVPPAALRSRAEKGYGTIDGKVFPLAEPNAIRATAARLRDDLGTLPDLPEIPFKFVRGEESRFVTKAAWHRTKQAYARAQFEEIAGVDHYFVEARPAKTAASINAFIAPAHRSQPSRLSVLPDAMAPTPDAALIRLNAVGKHFRSGGIDVPALEDISFELREREFIAIVGPSGCGKSSLLNILAGIDEQFTGQISFADQENDRRFHCAYMFQNDLLLPWRRIVDNVALGLMAAGVNRNEARRRAMDVLQRFGLGDYAASRPIHLSGGMRQRVALLRTLLLPRPVLLLDEPFGALDALTRAHMQDWLLDVWQQDGRSVIFVTHDVEEAVFLADRVLVIGGKPGRIKSEISVTSPRPRTREVVTTPEFVNIKKEVLSQIYYEHGDDEDEGVGFS